MRQKRNSKPVLLIISIVLCIALLLSVGGLLAFLHEESNNVNNLFEAGVKYTLTYNANGGDRVVEDDIYVGNVLELTHTFTITDSQPGQNGDSLFLGWAESADATEAQYSAGDNIVLNITDKDKILYAVWGEQNPYTYTLKFRKNLPSGVTGTNITMPETKTKNSAKTTETFQVNEVPSDANIDDTGVIFLGWATDDVGDIIYEAGDEISIEMEEGQTEASLTLYGVWGFEYYVIFDRGVTNSSVGKYSRDTEQLINTDYQDQIILSETTATISLIGLYESGEFEYKRSGYMLAGFTLTAGETNPSENITVSTPGRNHATTVYAYWLSGSYALLYDVNGGDTAPDSQVVTSATASYTFYVSSVAPTAATGSDAQFLGWADSPDATEAKYQAGDQIILYEDNPGKTLYAIWVYTYSLTFNKGLGNTGTSVPETITIQTVERSVTFTIPATPIPTRTNYDFLFWTENENRVNGEKRYYGEGVVTTIENIRTTITASMTNPHLTLYAHYQPSAGYQLIFNANGGTLPSSLSTITSRTTEYVCNFTIPEGKPTKSNNTFLGWADSSSATAAKYYAGDIVSIDPDKVASKTLYAVWKPYNEFRVVVNYNGGSTGSSCNPVTSYTSSTGYSTGTSYTFSSIGGWLSDFKAPTRSGYTLLGFAYSSNALVRDFDHKENGLFSDYVTISNLTVDYGNTRKSISRTSLSSGDTQYYRYTLTLWAVWGKNDSYDYYRVTLDANGSGASSVVSTYSYVQQDGIMTHTFAATSFNVSTMASRTGYKLIGFAYNADALEADIGVNGNNLATSVTVTQGADYVVASKSGDNNYYTLTLYAVWEKQQIFRIEIDANEGSISSSATYPEATENVDVTSYTWTNPGYFSTLPSRSGYSLAGFSYSPNATVAELNSSYSSGNGYYFGQSVTIDQADIGSTERTVTITTNEDGIQVTTLTVYAVWKKLQYFSVKLDFNGGYYQSSSSGTSSTDTTTVSTTDLTKTAYTMSTVSYTSYYSTKASRTNYKFLGFAYSPNATEADFEVTTVTGSSSNTYYQRIYDVPVDQADVGSTERNVTYVSDANGIATTTLTLYAVWERQQNFVVKFDFGEGAYTNSSGTVATTVSYSVQRPWYEETYTFSSAYYTTKNSAPYTWAGHKLLGFAYSADATEVDFTVTTTSSSSYYYQYVYNVLIDESNTDAVISSVVSDAGIETTTITLYAVWETQQYFEVHLDLGEGYYNPSSGAQSSEALQTVQVSMDAESYIFDPMSYTSYYTSAASRTGYVFLGYSYSSAADKVDFTVTRTGSSNSYTQSLGTVTVAKADIGSADKTVVNTVDENGIEKTTLTLYAVWGIQLYYLAQGGTGAPATVTRIMTEGDTNRTFVISSMVPTKQSYSFMGWSLYGDITNPIYGIEGTYITITNIPLEETITFSDTTGSMNLYAVWCQEYVLLYSANGGDEDSTPEFEHALSGESHPFEISTTIPYREGYTFLGWATTADASVPEYHPDGVTYPKYITVEGSDDGSTTTTTLYAVWQQN